MKPAASALAFLRRKQLKPAFDYRDVWQEEHHLHFTVAKAMRLDILEAIYQAVVDAAAEGQTLRQFRKSLTPVLQKKGWWGVKPLRDPVTGDIVEARLGSPRRLRVIYDTNMRAARAAGQWGRIQRGKRSHPYLIYELGPSREHRDQHVAWQGLILPVDHPFWEARYPPNGWGCKCRVRAITQAEYGRLQGSGRYSTEAPAAKYKQWVNKRTGEVERVAEGVHPAFNYHIGKHRQLESHSLIRDKINASTSDLALGTVLSLVASQVFTDWFRQPAAGSRFVIAALDEDLQRRLGARQKAVLLGDETLAKQRKHHPELTLAEYRLLPEIINTGMVIKEPDQRLLFFESKSTGKLYMAVIKTTENGAENYLTSFRRTTVKDMRRKERQGRVIRKWKD